MSTINERQNNTRNLEKLAAQRALYSQAKVWLGISIIISMPLMVIITLLALFFNNPNQAQNWGFVRTNLDWLVILVSFLVLLTNDLVLMHIVEYKKELASRIQESFDCDVLDLDWNHLVGEIPEPAQIYRNSRKLLEDPVQKDKLRNWYGENIDGVPQDAGKIICQLSNIAWDKTLREQYQRGIFFFGMTMIIILFFFGIYLNLNFHEWIVFLLAPSFPIIDTVIKHWHMQHASIKTLKRMYKKANHEWKNYLKTLDESRIITRQIQDEIYKHRRSNTPIFDWLYYWRRISQEEEQSYSVEHYINEYEIVFNKAAPTVKTNIHSV